MKKLIAILVALAMAAMLSISAFAADDDPATTDPTEPTTSATQDKTTTAPITKTLTVPDGTAIPANAQATFTFTNLKVNGADPENTDPTIGTETLNMASGGTKADAEGNIDVYTYNIPDVLDGLNWARPGVYEWTVQEDTYTADDQNPDTTDHLNKDNTVYKMVVKVVYDEHGNLVVDEVIVKDGGSSTTDYDSSAWNEADGLAWANAYYTTTGNPGTPDPEDPDKPVVGPENNDDAGLAVKKMIDGDLGDKGAAFEITVTLDLPQIPGANTAEAVIRGADGTTVRAADLSTGKVSLKHGETLVFTKIAEGTKYSVKETDNRVGTALNQYTATYKNQDDAAYTAGTKTAVVKGDNAVTIFNKLNQENTPPTGILISNLPYIALALVAIGGLVAYVVVRRRQDDEA